MEWLAFQPVEQFGQEHQVMPPVVDFGEDLSHAAGQPGRERRFDRQRRQ